MLCYGEREVHWSENEASGVNTCSGQRLFDLRRASAAREHAVGRLLFADEAETRLLCQYHEQADISHES